MFYYLLVMVMLLPVSLTIIGRGWIKKPPKKINGIYGYRTSRSMRSQESWDYAHKYFGRIWFFGGIFTAILSLISMIIWKNVYESASIIIITVQAVLQFFSIIPTEFTLKKHFDRNGRPIA